MPHSQRSIRHRSGSGIVNGSSSSVSSRRKTAPRHVVASDLPPRDAHAQLAGQQSNSHATSIVSSQSNGSHSHFTAIPARSRRSSILSSRSGLHLHQPSSFPVTSPIATKTWIESGDDLFSSIAPPDVRNDPVASSPAGNPPTLYSSHFTTKIQHLAKHISSLAHSALSSLYRRQGPFSFPNPRNLSLPVISFTSNNRPSSPKNSSGLERGLTPADKLTHKWPRPRSSRSAAPWIRSTNPLLHRSIRDLRGAGGWSQGHMEAILQDSRGLGINWIGQWTIHKWCLLASVTIVFLLGLTSLVFSLLTWFAGKLQ